MLKAEEKSDQTTARFSNQSENYILKSSSFNIPNKLEYKTVLYYKVLLRYKTVFFATISVQTSILLYKTVFYRIQTMLLYDIIPSFLVDVVTSSTNTTSY